jgi:hypothetical protein
VTETATLFIKSCAGTARFKVNANVSVHVLDPTHWSGSLKRHTGGEGPEVLGREVFPIEKETVATHDRKLRRWVRI